MWNTEIWNPWTCKADPLNLCAFLGPKSNNTKSIVFWNLVTWCALVQFLLEGITWSGLFLLLFCTPSTMYNTITIYSWHSKNISWRKSEWKAVWVYCVIAKRMRKVMHNHVGKFINKKHKKICSIREILLNSVLSFVNRSWEFWFQTKQYVKKICP